MRIRRFSALVPTITLGTLLCAGQAKTTSSAATEILWDTYGVRTFSPKTTPDSFAPSAMRKWRVTAT